ncbi:putative acetyltransferase [Desulfatibacillum alkenivorans DSM 16219]|uniref:Putative acetyltransferase n=1 Tax=Desulfatibacillum alkenivorans DSM 16219 TaxID=1121393 RepID=A0A1M6S001_9BACT|nr:GNAT family N-acetyltransferase [Desulfatibacillum alkenivorans]SHK38094.1 putative acetyltransferase [Desulfatibacillum alkenivorans DSM 16219]
MIRPMKSSDMDAVLTIWLEASIESHDFAGRDFWESRLEDMRNIYLPASKTYVFVEDVGVKGFVSLHQDVLAALFVSPKEQGRGIGGLLMDKAKSLRNRLRLSVYKENQKSVRFYEKRGFIAVREQKDQHTGRPEIVMTFH